MVEENLKNMEREIVRTMDRREKLKASTLEFGDMVMIKKFRTN